MKAKYIWEIMKCQFENNSGIIQNKCTVALKYNNNGIGLTAENWCKVPVVDF